MTTRSSFAPLGTAASDDYTYGMQVHVPLAQIIEALTDDTVISRWWTAVTRSERHGDEVQLFMGGDAPAVVFTVEHAPGTSEVTWSVTDCAVMADWVGTKPSFAVQPNDDGTCTIAFRHIGLRPRWSASTSAVPAGTTSCPACTSSSRPASADRTSRATRRPDLDEPITRLASGSALPGTRTSWRR